MPDLITFAKGVNSGYVPVGGVIISDPIAATSTTRVFPGGLTYSGTRWPWRRIVATLNGDGGGGRRRQRGADRLRGLGPGLADLAERHELVGEVRGTGRLLGHRARRRPRNQRTGAGGQMAALKRDLVARGLLPFVADNRIHVVPPCVVTPAEARQGLRLIDDALSALGG